MLDHISSLERAFLKALRRGAELEAILTRIRGIVRHHEGEEQTRLMSEEILAALEDTLTFPNGSKVHIPKTSDPDDIGRGS